MSLTRHEVILWAEEMATLCREKGAAVTKTGRHDIACYEFVVRALRDPEPESTPRYRWVTPKGPVIFENRDEVMRAMPDPTPTPPGVQFNAPPADLQPALRETIAAAILHLNDSDKNGALVAVANEHGANAAIVARVYDGRGWKWDVQAWVGKSWHGSAEYGASVEATW